MRSRTDKLRISRISTMAPTPLVSHKCPRMLELARKLIWLACQLAVTELARRLVCPAGCQLVATASLRDTCGLTQPGVWVPSPALVHGLSGVVWHGRALIFPRCRRGRPLRCGPPFGRIRPVRSPLLLRRSTIKRANPPRCNDIHGIRMADVAKPPGGCAVIRGSSTARGSNTWRPTET